MNFFKNIVASIYSPAFYSKISQQSLGSAIGYFALFTLLLAIIQTSILFFSQGLINFQKDVEKVVNQAVVAYPTDLTIKIEKGTVSTTVKEPYVIPFPGAVNGEKTNLVVIDTKTPFSASAFNKYDTFIWLTRDAIFVADDTAQMRSIDLSEVRNFTLDKKLIESLAKEYSPWLKFITPVVTIVMLIVFYIANFSRLLYLFLLALLIMLLTKLMKKSLSYGQAYKVGIYAMTAGFSVDVLLMLTASPSIPFLFTIVTLLVIFINIKFAKIPVKHTASKKKKKN